MKRRFNFNRQGRQCDVGGRLQTTNVESKNFDLFIHLVLSFK